MIKFINLKSGKLYTGDIVYTQDKDGNDILIDGQKIIDYSKSFIQWIPGEQSTDIIYTPHICFISDQLTLNVSIESNDIFKLIDPSRVTNPGNKTDISGIEYTDINDLVIVEDSYESTGIKYQDHYIHTIYFKIQSEIEGEAIVKIMIGGNPYLIGADFYIDNELYKINLQNYNICIPDQVQKALYPSNIHEDKRDNILLNRKWKELLSNYWDIVANKGSYKSLINSLNWFEYGDLLELKEYWKTEDFFKTTYSGKSIESVLSDKYSDILTTSSKTTYIGIYAALQELKKDESGQVTYDKEKNPELKNTAFDIALNDLYIKMSLLGVFYKTFFMPIHLDLIHSTIENKVFTNTIKVCKVAVLSREDIVCPTNIIECSLGSDDVFAIGKKDITVQVDDSTLFGYKYDENGAYDCFRVGVMSDRSANIPENATNNLLETFWTQYYKGPGVIVPFTCTLYSNYIDDFINFEQIYFQPDKSLGKKYISLVNNKIFKFEHDEASGKYKTTINFELLCTEERTYNVKLVFKSAESVSYIKDIKFDVVCIDNSKIDIYKIRNNGSAQPNTPDQIPAIKYVFKRDIDKVLKDDKLNIDDFYYTQYLPIYKGPNYKDYKGIKLNHLMVFKDNNTQKLLGYSKYYKYDVIENTDGQYIKDESTIKYTIYISNDFCENIPPTDIQGDPIRNELIYIPHYHHLELMKRNSIDLNDYTINEYDTLCLVPNFFSSRNIENPEWSFENASTGENIKLPSIQTPYIANIDAKDLSDGYYNIIFKYKLDEKEQIYKINSAFLKRNSQPDTK